MPKKTKNQKTSAHKKSASKQPFTRFLKPIKSRLIGISFAVIFIAIGLVFLFTTRASDPNPGLAREILANPNITYWTNNGVNSRDVMVAISQGRAAYTTCNNVKNKTTGLNSNMLRFLAEAGRSTKVMVNALTDKCHSAGSLHYSGQAIDLEKRVGDTATIIRIAGKYGGTRNNETSHIHLTFSGSTPPPTSAPPAGSPKGNVDSVNCNMIRGWAYDPDESNRSIEIHVYLDGPYGSARASMNGGATSGDRPDVNNTFSIGGRHGFNIQMPNSWLDGKQHTLYIYGINVGRGDHWLQRVTFDGCGKPIGNIDSSDCSGIKGWILDMQAPSSAVTYHVYVDGAPGAHHLYAENAGPTKVSRPDVNKVYGVSGTHGFNYQIPKKLRDGKRHVYRIYAINIGAGSTNPQIAGERAVTCR